MKTLFKYFVLIFSLHLIEGSFRCDYNYSFMAKAWFKHLVVPATWFDARLRCTLEGAALASPTTLEIKTEMTHILKDFTPQYEIFTGIHATLSQGDYHTVEGTPLARFPVTWAENEPNNKDNKENCITFNGNGDLADRPCEETRTYICYRSEDSQVKGNECGTVDPEYHLDKRTNKCYKFHLEPRNFSRASFACAAEGGHLAVINSDIEAGVLQELFATIPKSDMYGMPESWKDAALIGYYDWGEHGEWRTVHGQTLSEAGYNKWNTGEPSATPEEFCGSLWRNGYLNDVWCNKNFSFICEKSPDYPAVCRADQASLVKSSNCGQEYKDVQKKISKHYD